MKPRAIGGYFELERPRPRAGSVLPGLPFQSARAALTALLDALGPKHLWIPALSCAAISQVANFSGVKTTFYELDPATGAPLNVDLGEKELLLAINYMGVCASSIKTTLKDFEPTQVIVDNAQALFAKPSACLANLYSPRKFVGVPDGGLLVTNARIPLPTVRDDGSIARCTHLLKRMDGLVEEGYNDFLAAEQSLEASAPRRMSILTHALLTSVDLLHVRRLRVRNYSALHKVLGDENQWPFPLPTSAPALAYPFLGKKDRDDGRLSKKRLYLPTFWPEARMRTTPGSLERTWIDRLMPLPVDQRYTVDSEYLFHLRSAGIPC